MDDEHGGHGGSGDHGSGGGDQGPSGGDQGGHGGSNNGHGHIEIEVNTKKVELTKQEVTGLEIKEAAIAQHVNIALSFVLQQELANGSSKIIGDHDVVHIHEQMRFTAIAADDNS